MPGDELQKQVSEGKVSVSGSNDVLTMALGPSIQADLRVLLQEENKKMEAKARDDRPAQFPLWNSSQTSAEISAESPLYFDQSQNFPPVKQSVHLSQQPEYRKIFYKTLPWAEAMIGRWWIPRLGRHAGYPSRKLAKSGDYDQPVPPADSSMTPSQLESLWQDAGDRSQPDPQSWQVSGHQVCRAANPGTHGPSVPETREAKSSALT
ncbi:hypothetical protein Prudu_1135S000800 [Prunus dulcis]|uniref:Uncharacterized protein n=1 Tax=Prunus dulcis TaxID=3755 RepID=A0A5H2XNW6_PRUDU|nr:hypothetical protein Prudu_1135S000800 [Prunus dulcis]